MAVATVYEKTDDPANAINYLRTAATLNRDTSRHTAIAKRIAAIEERLRIDAEDANRRPVIRLKTGAYSA